MLQKCKVETNDKNGGILSSSGGVVVCQSVKKMREKIESAATETRNKINESIKLEEINKTIEKVEETERKINNKINEAKDKASDITTEIQTKINQITDEIDKISTTVQSIPDTIEKINTMIDDSLSDTVQKGKEVIEDISKRITDNIDIKPSIILDERNKTIFTTNPLTGIVEQIEVSAKEALERIVKSTDEFADIWNKYLGLPIFNKINISNIQEGITPLLLVKKILEDCEIPKVKLDLLKTQADIVKLGDSIPFVESCVNLLPGDIICWSAINSNSVIGHIGIYIGEGNVIHAPCVGQVVKVQKIWQNKNQKVLKVIRPKKA